MKTIISGFFFLCLLSCSWLQPEYRSGQEGHLLPAFNFRMQDSVTPFATTDIPEGKPFVLLLYRPDCGYCKQQVEDLQQNIKSLADIHIYMVSGSSYRAISQFADSFHLDHYSNFTLVRDSANKLLDYFNPPVVPYLAFYDDQKKLSKVLVGRSTFTIVKNIIAGQTSGHLASKP
jgi:peroxiredoxin